MLKTLMLKPGGKVLVPCEHSSLTSYMYMYTCMYIPVIELHVFCIVLSVCFMRLWILLHLIQTSTTYISKESFFPPLTYE